jgi:general secretion pathway protein K
MLVMVVLFALTVIIAAFAYSMSVEIKLAQINDYDDELEWMGRSGIELARYALAVKCPEQRDIDALNQFWAGGTSPCSNDVPQFSLKGFPLGRGTISVTITDMERKFDINLVANPKGPALEVMQKAMLECGVTDPSQSSKIIDSVMDWLSKTPDAHPNGAKDDYYNNLNPPYYCKSGPMDDINELLLVNGVTPEIFWGSNSTNHPPAPYENRGFNHMPGSTRSRFRNEANDVPNPVGLVELFNAFGGKLNINTADVKTLQLLPGIDAGTAQRIIEQRNGPDGIPGTEDDVPFHNVTELNSGLPGGLPPGRGAQQVGIANAPPAGLAAGGLAAYCDVRSYVFLVDVVAEINNVKRNFVGVISRSGQNANQITCVRFHSVDEPVAPGTSGEHP